MKLNSFEELFECLLCDIYSVENLIVKNMPALIQRAYSKELKEGLQTHLDETKEQVKRLDKVFKLIHKSPQSVEWATDINKLFVDAESFLKDNTSSPLLDAAIIAVAQRIEHFEIATYGTLQEYADVLDLDEVQDILKDTIKEEGHSDKVLTKLAKGGLLKKGINVEAANR